MDMMSRLSDGYSRLFSVFGRATRGQFWTLFFANLVIFVIGVWLNRILPESLGMAAFLFGLVAVSFANVTATVRRLHDTNRSGWWALVGLIPVAQIVVIYYLLKPSLRGPTRYDAHARTPSHPVNAGPSMSDVARALGS